MLNSKNYHRFYNDELMSTNAVAWGGGIRTWLSAKEQIMMTRKADISRHACKW